MTRAFTLIEQLAALALSGLFLFAALAVLGIISRDHDAAAHVDDLAPLERTAELIQRDLSGAQRLRIGHNQFSMSGFCGIDPATLGPRHLPVRVTYRVQETNGELNLIRRQEALDVLSNRNVWSELVCRGISGIELRMILPTQRPATQPAPSRFGSADGQIVPAALRLLLRPADDHRPGLDRVLCIR